MQITSCWGNCARLFNRGAVVVAATVAVWCTTSELARSQPYVLNSGNSTLYIDPTRQDTGYDWIVDNVHHMKELSNWYRVGSSGPEHSVHTLTVQPGIVSASNNTVTVPYSDSLGRFALEIDYSVFGGPPGSGTSAFDEEVRITNLSQATPLAFHFFEYVDLDLHESPNDDTVLLTSPNTLQQYDALTVGNWSFDVDHYELDTYPNTLTKLTGGTASILGNGFGPGPVGPANVTFALQWDFVGTSPPRPAIGPGQTAVITKEGLLQMYFIPEPSSFALVAVGAALICLRRRFQAAR
jgi:hypothetical protein